MTTTISPMHLRATPQVLADYCQRNGIRSLALFGSYLHGDAHSGSDIDLLVEYDLNRRIGLFDMTRMAMELSELLGRPVDLRTPRDLSEYFRAQVLSEARSLYES